MSGEVGVLNVGAGDVKLSFDPSNPAERIRACRIVKDMLRRGFALLVQVGTTDDGRPTYQRALDFNEATAEYIIADFDPLVAQDADKNKDPINVEKGATQASSDQPATPVSGEEPASAAVDNPVRRPRGRRRTIDAGATRSVAVARSAGG